MEIDLDATWPSAAWMKREERTRGASGRSGQKAQRSLPTTTGGDACKI
ncbi:hypothetical protein LNP74_29900 [Klebsiella pneumoniae subsp. pneumoniae]|nr:hypothetical protein [Klebsiella pneumoniae subsp. pneumoniae]